jgi:hypothetical protein
VSLRAEGRWKGIAQLAHSTSVRQQRSPGESYTSLVSKIVLDSRTSTHLIGLKKKGLTTFISRLHSPVTPVPENLSRASIYTPHQALDRNIRTRTRTRTRTRRTRNTALFSSSSPRLRDSRKRVGHAARNLASSFVARSLNMLISGRSAIVRAKIDSVAV